jgi:uncharacterized protein
MNEVGALIAAVFAASLLGSLHCAGMCSPFLMFAVASDDNAPRRGFSVHAAYHAGRLATYTTLGIIAGAIGQALDLGGSSLGIGRLAAILAGALMIAFGLGAVLRTLGAKIPKLRTPRPLLNIVKHGHRVAFNLEPTQRALAIGLLTTLLPCGWLYAFAVAAAGTGSPILGGLTMAVFWTGTLPVMISLGVGLRELTGPVRRFVPLVSSLVVVVIGVATVFGRAQLPSFSDASHAHAAPVGLTGAADAVADIDQSELPCCTTDDAP